MGEVEPRLLSCDGSLRPGAAPNWSSRIASMTNHGRRPMTVTSGGMVWRPITSAISFPVRLDGPLSGGTGHRWTRRNFQGR
jgi:hypothetical protein